MGHFRTHAPQALALKRELKRTDNDLSRRMQGSVLERQILPCRD